MTQGIYRITNTNNGKCYIGSSVDCKARTGVHAMYLRNQKHGNGKLQNAWNKHGSDAFVWNIVEIVTDELFLRAREQFWIWRERPSYNISDDAWSAARVPSVRAKMRAHVRTLEHCARISMALKGKIPKRNIDYKPRSGFKQTPEHIAKRVASRNYTLATKGYILRGRKTGPNAKISAALMGRPCPGKGKSFSEDGKERVSIAAFKRHHGDDWRAAFIARHRREPRFE